MSGAIERNGGQILVESLTAAGTEFIFGVPGDTGVVFYDALRECTGKIRHVLANDERCAVFMADVFARSSNRVGVAEVSSGGGSTFAVGGLGEAFAASVPLVLIASDIQTRSRGTGAITEIDVVRLFAGVTKRQEIVSTTAAIPQAVTLAFAAATSGRPGPVVLILPEDVLEGHADVPTKTIPSHLPSERLPASDKSVALAAATLAAAKRPAIVAGSGVHWSAAWKELTGLSEKLAAPVATTIHGKGAISERHPLSLGIVGSNGARPYANDYLANADAVLFIGTRANSTDTNGFTSPPRNGPAVIQIDIEAERAGRNFPGSLPLVGDARAILDQLRRAVPQAAEDVSRARIAELAERRTAWWSAQPPRPANGQLDPYDIISAISRIAADDAIVVGEPGTPTPYLSSYWEIPQAGRRVILPRGHGPMGYALPGAVGAAMAHPGKPIIAFTTDGSLLMACGALEQVKRLKLPITYIHFNNASLGWIKTLQHLYFERRFFGVDFERFDAAVIARGFGLEASRPADVNEIVAAVKGGMESMTPLFLDVWVPAEHELLPPVAPWVAAVQGDVKRPIY